MTHHTWTYRITALRKKKYMLENGKVLLGRKLFTDTQQKCHYYPGRKKGAPLETTPL